LTSTYIFSIHKNINFNRYYNKEIVKLEVSDSLYTVIKDKIKIIIIDKLGVEESKITLDASFINDLGADSLDVIEIIIRVEDEFQIKIPEEDNEKLKKVGDIVNYVHNKIKGF
jgi:acyl carrier protein